MLSRTEKFVKSFDISCSRKEAIGAFFQPLLESSAAAHPSVASQSPSTGALFLSAINCFNVRNHHETAQRLIKINDELKEHDSVCRFLLLLTNLPREQKAAESRKALVGLTPVKEELPPFPTVFPKEQICIATPDSRLERSSKNTPSREISSPDQGIDLEESPKSADCDSLERLSFIETLVALHPNRTWIKTPKSEVVFCLLRLFGGHETWLFPFHSQKCEFVMKEGAFLDGLSPAAFKNSLQLVLNASNCLVRLEKCSESKSESRSLPVRAFKYALGDYVRRKREAAGNVLSRDENTLFHALHHVKRLCREIALVTDTMLQLVTSEITSQELVDRICDVRGLFSADASAAQAINDLLSAVCKQLNRSLDAWLTTGVAQEKSFIISESAESSSVRERLQSREFWRTDYGISLPPFGLITASLSSDILAVGKVRRLANEWDQFRLNYDVQLDIKNDNSTCKTVIADQSDVDEDLKADDFQLRLIYSIECRVRSAQRDPCLLACLSKAREMFHENLLLLRRVFFQEDRLLAASLNIALHQLVINERSASRTEDDRSPMRLNALLDAALEDANYDGLLAQRFSFVATAAPSTGGVLAKLALSCSLPYPVNLIISTVAVDGYALVWRLFAQLGVAHTSLLQLKKVMFNHGAAAGQTRFLLARFAMINFITSLQSYFWHQIVKVVPDQFQLHFENANSVDELHAVHKKYLSAVLARCFLGPKAVSMITVLNGCLDTIAFFCAAISNDPPALPDATKASMAFSKTALLFVKAIRNLIKANYEPWLEDLLLRLDMSEFYTRQDR